MNHVAEQDVSFFFLRLRPRLKKARSLISCVSFHFNVLLLSRRDVERKKYNVVVILPDDENGSVFLFSHNNAQMSTCRQVPLSLFILLLLLQIDMEKLIATG